MNLLYYMFSDFIMFSEFWCRLEVLFHFICSLIFLLIPKLPQFHACGPTHHIPSIHSFYFFLISSSCFLARPTKFMPGPPSQTGRPSTQHENSYENKYIFFYGRNLFVGLVASAGEYILVCEIKLQRCSSRVFLLYGSIASNLAFPLAGNRFPQALRQTTRNPTKIRCCNSKTKQFFPTNMITNKTLNGCLAN